MIMILSLDIEKSKFLLGNPFKLRNVPLLGFHQVWYQGIVKATVSGVLEDLALKVSEGSDQN